MVSVEPAGTVIFALPLIESVPSMVMSALPLGWRMPVPLSVTLL
ncbi:MAG: hypothetical protein NTW19_21470 [Planctomycetota bacterium]|nr:hypothetical protein [Planctomycetota bacterium]